MSSERNKQDGMDGEGRRVHFGSSLAHDPSPCYKRCGFHGDDFGVWSVETAFLLL